ncbi:hypothetical protein [Bdellovibrio sp. HCB209]|uniref:hypothetical protein n=1 Tax=Bdellovibrio sp. HCB209 TaxID=3394354 RepID=UPI0039B51B41
MKSVIVTLALTLITSAAHAQNFQCRGWIASISGNEMDRAVTLSQSSDDGELSGYTANRKVGGFIFTAKPNIQGQMDLAIKTEVKTREVTLAEAENALSLSIPAGKDFKALIICE